jgi:hypothetical protein
MSKKRNNKKVSKTAAQDMEDAYQMESGYDLAMIGDTLLTPERRKKLKLIREIFPESPGKQAGRKLYKKGKSISKSIGEDETEMPKEDMGPVMDSIEQMTEMEDKAPIPKKDKKKVKKKMGGGQVYKRGHGGKVIKNNMSGQDLVNACYDN